MELFENRARDSVGSSRLRCNWLVRNWPEAKEYVIAEKFDAFIFQKAYFLDYMRVFPGVKIFDICDPDWLDGKPVIEAINLCDAVTCSSQALVDYIQQMTSKPVYYIPDRIDLTLTPQRKEHAGRARTAVWYGYSSNQKVLDQCLSTIKRLGLTLTVISELPYFPETSIEGIDDEWVRAHIKNIKYDADTINQELVMADIVLNPKLPKGRFQFKSDNKTVLAWALGMPVAIDAEDMERFMDEDERRKEAELRGQQVVKYWDINISVREFRDIIEKIAEQKNADANLHDTGQSAGA